MSDSQEDGEEEAYPGGDAYSQESLEELPGGDVQCLIARLRLLIPGGDTAVEVAHTPAGPAFQSALGETGIRDPQKEVDETIQR